MAKITRGSLRPAEVGKSARVENRHGGARARAAFTGLCKTTGMFEMQGSNNDQETQSGLIRETEKTRRAVSQWAGGRAGGGGEKGKAAMTAVGRRRRIIILGVFGIVALALRAR